MSVLRIATRYAKSLLDLAIEQQKLEPVYHDVQVLASAVQNRDLVLLLKSPIIQGDKKIAAMDALFKGKLDVLTLAYVRLLVEKGREAYLPEIAREFVSQYKRYKRITTVRVISAAPLSEEVMTALHGKLLASHTTSDQLEMETRIDPKLIGGFIVEFDDKRYDASVINKLNELRVEFKKNLYIKEF
jgi:F-type H+-transporting ATPase subunit delta